MKIESFVLNIFKQKNKGLYRERKPNPKNCISFSSNDYLGLAKHPLIIKAYKDALDKYGTSSSSSYLLGGYSFEHQALEGELAGFLNCEDVLLFSTGYMANIGVIRGLFDGDDKCIFLDRLAHASINEAVRYSRANLKRYKHANSKHLEQLIDGQNSKSKIIATEGVFSMDGDIGPIVELVKIAKKNGCWLIADDAHGIGVLGDRGQGVFNHCNLSMGDNHILVGTFGKAFGTFGAFVGGSKPVIENLVQFAKSYTYTTGLAAAVAAATRVSLALLQKENWRRDYLKFLIGKFKRGATKLNFPLLDSDTPIQPLIIGDAKLAQKVAGELQNAGILVGLSRPPTVPVGSSRLRITLSVNQAEKDIENLLNALSDFVMF